MKYFAVLDTNVLVSALLRSGSVPAKILDEAASGSIIPLFNDDILAEYEDVLRRKKFPFADHDIKTMINAITIRGFE